MQSLTTPLNRDLEARLDESMKTDIFVSNYLRAIGGDFNCPTDPSQHWTKRYISTQIEQLLETNALQIPEVLTQFPLLVPWLFLRGQQLICSAFWWRRLSAAVNRQNAVLLNPGSVFSTSALQRRHAVSQQRHAEQKERRNRDSPHSEASREHPESEYRWDSSRTGTERGTGAGGVNVGWRVPLRTCETMRKPSFTQCRGQIEFIQHSQTKLLCPIWHYGRFFEAKSEESH